MPPPIDEIPSHVRSLLIFGGTFDPPHVGHIKLPELVRQQLKLDWLLYIPAASPPLKRGPIATEQQRLEMLTLALKGSTNTSISTIEFQRGGTSYTHDTLLTLHEQYPDLTMRLLIGADQALQFHKWRNACKIIQLAEPVVMLRDDIAHDTSMVNEIAEHWSNDELAQWKRRFTPVPSIECSSTSIRQWLADIPANRESLQRCLTADVLRSIEGHNPYT